MQEKQRIRNSKTLENLLTVKQLSEFLQLSSRTTYERTHIGFIPRYKFPKKIRFSDSQVKRCEKKRERQNFIYT